MSKRYSGKSFKDASVMKKAKLSLKEKRKIKKESAKLQKGMNFRLKGRHSVLLMSVRKNSPYQDEISEDGAVLMYEGHDVPKIEGVTYPKQFDQPEYRSSGRLTENGKFNRAAQEFKTGKKVLILFGYMKKLNLEFGQIMDISI